MDYHQHMEHYSDEAVLFVTIYMSLGTICGSEISHIRKDERCMIPLICESTKGFLMETD